MTLATASADGEPAARTVLLKGATNGFVFYTQLREREGPRPRRESARVPVVLLGRARAAGAHHRSGHEDDDAKNRRRYFHSRPFESQIGAAISDQSRPVADRSQLEKRYAELAAKYQGAIVPLPAITGAAIASSPRRLNSGRAARAACTIDCSTRGRPTARGRARDWNRDGFLAGPRLAVPPRRDVLSSPDDAVCGDRAIWNPGVARLVVRAARDGGRACDHLLLGHQPRAVRHRVVRGGRRHGRRRQGRLQASRK